MSAPEGNRHRRAAAMSALTSVTVTGSVVTVFTLLTNTHLTHAFQSLPVWLAVVVGVPTLAVSLGLGGALWGWGAASLFGRPRWPATKTGALSIAGMFILLEAPVHASQALPTPAWMPLGIHGLFTLVFALEIALVAGIASSRLARRLGIDLGVRSPGMRIGLVGAAGGVAGSLVAHAIGFRVGAPPAFNMVWALYVVVACGGLSAGWTLGWLLAAKR